MTRPHITALARLLLPLSWWAGLTPVERVNVRFLLILAAYPVAMGLVGLLYVLFLIPTK